jgi:predicted nucleic acid-binding protein
MYLDTSIVVKLLTAEPDSDYFEKMVVGHPLSSSELLWTELATALLAKERTGKIKSSDRVKSWNYFLKLVDNGLCQLHETRLRTFQKAQQIAELCHPVVGLRALDALHLAACDLSQDFPLLTNDERMMAAAQRIGIPLA